MATSMDKLRDRWEQISPREQRMILALGITFILVVLALLGRGITGGLAALEEENQKTRTALRALEDYRQNLARNGDESPDIQLPSEPVKLQSYLEGIATEVGITIPGFNPQSGTDKGGVLTASTRIEIRGLSIEQLTEFLEKVESGQPHVVIESLEIQRHFRDKEKLDVTMLVTAYAREQQSAEGQPAGEAGGAGEAG